MRNNRGFTLIELMIVVAIIAIIASIAIPNLLAARLNANESAAVATLRNVVSAQSQVQSQGAIDVDLDGIGEHGWFAEMSGQVNLRDDTGVDGGPILTPPVLSASLGNVNAQGHVNKSGYFFKLHLPDVNGAPVDEDAASGSPGTEDDDLSETIWICYGWPASYSNTGNRAFVVNQTGDVLQTNNLNGAGSYTGTTGANAIIPAGDAAMDTADDITANLAIGGNAGSQDGNNWLVLN